ncbi:unnamed protein product [Allacma fusca]|uniref:Uncharacterized protein n=1 Tax=Allacma fusca TaxID=39272 RepID=A0A8J2J0A1_9HEXA|nr:unnamed protein product [Allacma fusca]
MDKWSRKERKPPSSESPPAGHGHELRTLPFSPHQEEKNERAARQGKSKHSEVESGDFRKKSRIQELLNSFKDDVIHMRDCDIISDEVSTDRYPIPLSGSSEFPEKFTRVSPHKLTSHSRWKKAVKLSRTVMKRPRQTLSTISRGMNDDDDFEEHQTKMIFLLKFIDHASCISSGLLAGLLLWSTLNAVSWHEDLIRTTYTNNFLRLYYTTTAVLMFITLVGFLIRIYSSWTRWTAWLIIYLIAFLAVLLLHYINKGYTLLRLECTFYDALNQEEREKAITAYSCSQDDVEIMKQDLIFITISSSIQMTGAVFIACYFHFTPYQQLWLLPVAKSKGRRASISTQLSSVLTPHQISATSSLNNPQNQLRLENDATKSQTENYWTLGKVCMN